MSAWLASFTKWFLAASTGMKVAVIGAVAVVGVGAVAVPVTLSNNSQVLTVQQSGDGNKANAAGSGKKTSSPTKTPTQQEQAKETSSPTPSTNDQPKKNTSRVPSAPTNPRFNQGGCGPDYCGAAITVNAPSDSGSSAITGYDVGYSTDGGANFTWVSFGNTPNYMMVDPMPASSSYDVIVRAKNAAGVSANSNMIRLPLTVQMVPSAPTGLLLGGRGCFAPDLQTVSCGGELTFTPPNAGIGPFQYLTGYSIDGGASWSFSTPGPGQQSASNYSFATGDIPYGNDQTILLIGVKAVNAYGESPVVSVRFNTTTQNIQ